MFKLWRINNLIRQRWRQYYYDNDDEDDDDDGDNGEGPSVILMTGASSTACRNTTRSTLWVKNSFHKVTGQPVFFPAQILARIFLLINVLSSVKSPLGIQHEGEKKKKQTNKQTNAYLWVLQPHFQPLGD